jgi:esterase/lipase superfamily enzyme
LKLLFKYKTIYFFCVVSFITSIQIVFLNCTFAQKEGFVYEDQIPIGAEIYVITNRLQTDTSNISKYVNSVREDQSLSFLKAEFNGIDSIQYLKIDSVSFLDEISQIEEDWVLFIHGDGKTLETSVWRAFDIHYYHNVKVLLFSWPSRDTTINGLKNFKNSKNNVTLSSKHFLNLLSLCEQFRIRNNCFSQGNSLNLFVHSLGNFHLENFCKEKQCPDFTNPLFDNLILNAAAVNQKNHKEWVEKLTIQKRIYITANKQDFNLKGVRIFTSDGKQLGEKYKNL